MTVQEAWSLGRVLAMLTVILAVMLMIDGRVPLLEGILICLLGVSRLC